MTTGAKVRLLVAIPAVFVTSWLALATVAITALLQGKVRQLHRLLYPTSGARL